MELLLDSHTSLRGFRLTAEQHPRRRRETLLLQLEYQWSRGGGELIVTEGNFWLRGVTRPERSDVNSMQDTTWIESRRIAHKIGSGSVTATIWTSEDSDPQSFTVTVTRPGEGTSPKLGRDDLLPLARILDEAHTWILRHSILTGRSEALAL